MIDLHLAIITGTDIGLVGQDPIPTVIDTEVTARVIHKEVTPGHIIDAHTEAHHATDTQTPIIIDEIHHIEDLHHTEVFLLIPKITIDLISEGYFLQNRIIFDSVDKLLPVSNMAYSCLKKC